MNIFKLLFSSEPKIDLKPLIEDGAFLVDVRSKAEYAAGHVKGSVNVPLDTIASKLSLFKNKKHIIVFCQSGGRSSMARAILKQNGYPDVINGGTWKKINELIA